MTGPRVLVLGAGSIGSRHVTNLAAIGCAVHVMDPDEARARDTARRVGGQGTVLDVDAFDGFDGIVIASPTVHHAEHLAAALAADARVLVEKPMTSSSAELDVVSGFEDRVMVGFNLRFHQPIQHIHDLVVDGAAGELVAGDFWFGHWLPAWRPTVDYRDTYSAQRALGGGVLMDAVHEIDLATWFFGTELTVEGALLERLGDLEVDVEDTAHILLSDPARRPVHVRLDYLSQRYRRGIEIIGTKATARFDWESGEVRLDRATGRDTHLHDVPVSRSYEEQIRHFVAWLGGGPPPPVNGRDGAVSVEIVDAIRRAAA